MPVSIIVSGELRIIFGPEDLKSLVHNRASPWSLIPLNSVTFLPPYYFLTIRRGRRSHKDVSILNIFRTESGGDMLIARNDFPLASFNSSCPMYKCPKSGELVSYKDI